MILYFGEGHARRIEVQEDKKAELAARSRLAPPRPALCRRERDKPRQAPPGPSGLIPEGRAHEGAKDPEPASAPPWSQGTGTSSSEVAQAGGMEKSKLAEVTPPRT